MADNDDYEILDDYYFYEGMDPCYREPQRGCLVDKIGTKLTDKVFDGTNYAERECLYWSYLEFSQTMEYANVTNIERKFHGKSCQIKWFLLVPEPLHSFIIICAPFYHTYNIRSVISTINKLHFEMKWLSLL